MQVYFDIVHSGPLQMTKFPYNLDSACVKSQRRSRIWGGRIQCGFIQEKSLLKGIHILIKRNTCIRKYVLSPELFQEGSCS